MSGLSTDVNETGLTLPTSYETAVKTINCNEKKLNEKTTDLTADLTLQMHLTDVQNSTLPIFTSLDSNLCETVIGVPTTLKELETHSCSDKLPAVTIEKVEKVNFIVA